MKYVGVDLHKKSITMCVMSLEAGSRERLVVKRRTFTNKQTVAIRKFFEQLGAFEVTVEATASYEWFLLLIEDLASRVALAHPKKLRVIAESKHKSDKIDAQVLAEFLALDMLPESYRPTPRIRQHRVLVRYRQWLVRRICSIKCKLRHKAAHYNDDVANLFSAQGKEHLAQIAMSFADVFEVQGLREQLALCERQLGEVDAKLAEFAREAPTAEAEARGVLATMPQVGPVTTDVVLSELGDWRRFRNAKQVVSFAGLDPGCRQSAGKSHQLHITKEGSRLLRWAMIQAAWRLVGVSPRWSSLFERVKQKTGSPKKAIVAVARHVLCVMFAMLRQGKSYQMAAA